VAGLYRRPRFAGMVRAADQQERPAAVPNAAPNTASKALMVVPTLVVAPSLATAQTAGTIAPAAPPAPANADPVVAQMGGFALTASALRGLLATQDPDQQQKLRSDPQALAAFVRDRMLQEAVLEAARAAQWEQKPETEARIEQSRRDVIADTYLAAISRPDPRYPSEAEIQAAYDANKAKLVVPRQLRLAQIFIAVPQGAGQGAGQAASKAADEAAKARIVELRGQWRTSKADPAALVKTQAGDGHPDAIGADLGWTREDQLLPAIRAAVAGMAADSVSEPIRLADGWHVVRVMDVRPAGPATLADVHDQLARALRQARQQQNVRATLDEMLKRAPIEVNEIALSGFGAK
jgi:peptidylprolyl isomerase